MGRKLTKAQGRALQDLQKHGDWVTAWKLGRQERVLNSLVEAGKAEVDLHVGVGIAIRYYRAV